MNFNHYTKYFINSYSYILIIFLAITIIFAPNQSFSRQEKQAFDSSIIVLAPTSMTNALNELLSNFSKDNNISVSATFESSSELSDIIETGEPANIFISEDKDSIINLQRLGSLNVFSLSDIISDKLVLTIPKNSFLKKKMESFNNTEEKLKFIAKNVTLVIPDPDSEPTGKAAKQAFEKINEWDNVKNKMLKAVNNRNALYLILNGNNAGITFASDINNTENAEILLEIPSEFYEKIVYQASIVADIDSKSTSNNSDKFLNYLKSDVAKKTFLRYGFNEI